MVSEEVKELGFFRTYNDIKNPEFATTQSACFDLRLYLSNDEDIEVWNDHNEKILYNYGAETLLTLVPGWRYKLPTGIIFNIPEGFHVEINLRSGTALKKGLVLINGTGIVDADYVNPVYVLVQNASKSIVTLEHDERFAQARMVPDVPTQLIDLDSAPGPKTLRNGGFNSTGTK